MHFKLKYKHSNQIVQTPQKAVDEQISFMLR